jgi:hypothetical protein
MARFKAYDYNQVNYPRLEGGGLGGMSITNRLSS